MDELAALRGERDMAASAIDAAWAERLAALRVGVIGGGLVALLGFALPWFRVSRSYLWWYGGWDLLTTNRPDLAWIGVLFLGYALIVVAGWFLPRFGIAEVTILLAAAIGLASAATIVVALAAADAVNDVGRVYRLDFGFGLPLLVVGHGVLIASAIAAVVMQGIRAALADLARVG